MLRCIAALISLLLLLAPNGADLRNKKPQEIAGGLGAAPQQGETTIGAPALRSGPSKTLTATLDSGVPQSAVLRRIRLRHLSLTPRIEPAAAGVTSSRAPPVLLAL